MLGIKKKEEVVKYKLTKEDKEKLLEHKERLRMLEFVNTTSKCLIWFFSINAVLWIWCSYILAFIGQPQIAESLSSNVCIVCIGQMVTYFITKTVENVFRYNNFGGKSTYEEKELVFNNIKIPTAQVPDIKEPVFQQEKYNVDTGDSTVETLALEKLDDYNTEVNNNEEFSTSFN